MNECSEPSSENSSRTETPNAEVKIEKIFRAALKKVFISQVSELWAKQREEMLAAAQKNKVYNFHKIIFKPPLFKD